MAQQVMSLPVTPDSHIRASVLVPAAWLQDLLPANVPEKAAADGPGFWAPATYLEALMEFQSPSFSLMQLQLLPPFEE